MKKEDKQVEINLGFVEKVNDFLRGLGKTSVLFFAIITIVTIVLVVLYINIFFGAAIERQKYEKMSVEEKVEKIYSEKFEIVSENFVNDKKVYKMNPVKNEEIEFTVVDNKSSIAEDYWTNRLKYEVENMDDKNLYNELRKEEYWNEDRGAKMLSYFAFWIEIENYADIEESVRKMYNLNEMLEEKIGRKTNLSECIRKGDYKSEIVYWRNDDIDEIIYNEKYEYINYLKENNLQDKTLSEDEINNIWRPKELEIIVNGNKLKPAFNRDNNYLARYNKKNRDYDIYFPALIKDLGIVIKDSRKKVVEFNGEKYKVIDDGKLKQKEIHRMCTFKELEEVFKVKTKIDFENKILYIDN